ncbi:MerR family transcriptional regulator [Paractinoplanes atraurantiacus]|uniref:DNA-binding transcriptional regulator, MerR family n=1 Tax=Paractinoplanes atraurantiacus TaxID=1036182 RepID=A0A285F894_9ACTN|nr:MerR family transcriptional regulator [Actinoplanes atraurantiacus]SNY06431.1 DNA-binding transcriptional regulator, MerR family [Actinoplanes atraurantiacus]
MRSIGEVARASGLSVSALRFYDGAGVLVPAGVDPATGYRRYADEQVRAARLIAGLRRVGMPVAEIAAAVREFDEPHSVRRRLDDHRRRLEDGLADAKRELLRIHALLDLEEHLMTRLTLPGAALAATIDAVRFAASADPALPMLGAVLFDVTGDELTLVATDRFRMAVAGVAATVEGPPVRAVLPLDFLDSVRPRLTHGPVVLDLAPADVRVELPGGSAIDGKPFDIDFPDHRRLLGGLTDPARRVTIDTAALRSAVAAAPAATREHEGRPYEVTVLGLGPDGSVHPLPESEWASDADDHVAVNREFLLQALDAGNAGQLILELDGPIKPLAVRVPGDNSRFSILMPVRH